ncbi:hypothetical protein GCM10022224_023460 [Nonomuraea antimicrobica]|uniref:Uncharacterized protein n=1 Tax=Nonomuraea antimicrobica TaxID=561173 RepID=A0ABP7BI95_9ACTN
MSWEFPASLEWVRSLVGSEADWPGDEMTRLDGAGGWMDQAAAGQGAQSQAGAAVDGVLASGNTGEEVNVFRDTYGPTEERMNDGAGASLLAGGATTVHVVFKVMWKWIVLIALIVLLIDLIRLIRAYAVNPGLGVALSRMRVLATRQGLRKARNQVKKAISGGAVHPLQTAKAILRAQADYLLNGVHRVLGVFATGPLTILDATGTERLDAFDDNPNAQRDAERVLEQTPEGRAALAFAREHGITTLWQSGPDKRYISASSYNPTYNVIQIGGAGISRPEALAAEFVRQVQIAEDRWDTQSASGWFSARDSEEKAANEAAYRMGSQLGYEEDARNVYLRNNDNPDANYGADRLKYTREWYEEDQPRTNLLDWAPRTLDGLFNGGPLDLKP